jgi:hypothetical protein
MALDFPSSPTLNDTYTEAGKTWRWNGTGWQLVTAGTVTNADISATAEIAVSKLADGNARQLLQTDAAGTGVEWTSNVDIPGTLDVTGATTLDSTLTVASNVTLNAQSDLRFADSDSSNWVAFQGPATVSSNVTWTLPAADGTTGQVLSTNGTGTLSWATGGGGGTAIEVGNTKAEVTDTGSNGTFTVTTEGTSRLTVGSTGNVSIANGNLVFSTSGTGIDFSANANAAGMTSELLDDYEEGTWTPVASRLSGGNISASYGSQIGRYTKVGRLVTIHCYLDIVSVTSQGSSAARIAGIPFNPPTSLTTTGAVFYNTAATTLVIGAAAPHVDGHVYLHENTNNDALAGFNWKSGIMSFTISYEI